MDISYKLKNLGDGWGKLKDHWNINGYLAKDSTKAFLITLRTTTNNPRTDIGPLLDVDGKIVNSDIEKAKTFNRYFCHVFGMQHEDVHIPHDDVDGIEILKLNIFKSTDLNNLHPTVWKELMSSLNH